MYETAISQESAGSEFEVLTTRHEAPNEWAGRLFRNLVLTTPELPCDLEIRPHMTRTLEPLISRLAL